jgi:hypothetical protein
MSDLFETIIADAKIREEREELLARTGKKDFKFGYIYGWMACYHQQTDCDLEEFLNELNQQCSINLTLNMLASLMEIISYEEPKIVGRCVKITNYETEYLVGFDENDDVTIIKPEDNIILKKFEYKGKKYMRDLNGVRVFDYEKLVHGEQVLVGTWDDDLNVIIFN